MRPELLLVHGAWHGPWVWDAVIPVLEASAVRTTALPSSGSDPARLGDFAADVRAVRASLAKSRGRDTVVVAHSYGGLPVTEAVCGHPEVVGVIYVAAFVADTGSTAAELFEGDPPRWWDLHPEQGYVDALDPETVFFGDVHPDLAAASAAQLVHQSLSVLGAAVADAAWRHVPTSYVVCDKDAAIPPTQQRQMAQHARRVHHLPSSHSPFLSMPDALADLINSEIREMTP